LLKKIKTMRVKFWLPGLSHVGWALVKLPEPIEIVRGFLPEMRPDKYLKLISYLTKG